MQMPEAEQMQFATPGPGTIRQPIDARQGAEDSDASDELKEEADCSSGFPSSPSQPDCQDSNASQPDVQDETPQEETVLGIDQTAGPGVVQCFAAVKLQTDLLQEHVQKNAPQLQASSDMAASTAQAAREAESTRIACDLQIALRKLLKHDFQKSIESLDKEEKGLLVPSGLALSTFSASTWTECFTEFWYGDALPNQKNRPRPITFEKIFPALMAR